MLQAETIPELLNKRASCSPELPAYWELNGQGNWESVKWIDFYHNVCRLGKGLKKAGLTKGQVVGIMLPTCFKWEVFHHAILSVGGVVVGLDVHDNAEQLRDIAKTAKIDILIVDKEEHSTKLGNSILGKLDFIVSVSELKLNEGLKVYSYKDLMDDQKNYTPESLGGVANKPDDIATIVFTSGTSGAPKGISYTHKQVL